MATDEFSSVALSPARSRVRFSLFFLSLAFCFLLSFFKTFVSYTCGGPAGHTHTHTHAKVKGTAVNACAFPFFRSETVHRVLQGMCYVCVRVCTKIWKNDGKQKEKKEDKTGGHACAAVHNRTSREVGWGASVETWGRLSGVCTPRVRPGVERRRF